MESLPEIDVVNSNPSELLATPLNITIQQNVNEDNNSSFQMITQKDQSLFHKNTSF